MASMLSTSDNPHNPFDDFDAWFNWDAAHGYNTPGLLSRLNITSQQLSDADQASDLEEAIDRIVEENFNGVMIKVTNG